MLTIIPRKYPHHTFMNLLEAKKNFFWILLPEHLSQLTCFHSKSLRGHLPTCFAPKNAGFERLRKHPFSLWCGHPQHVQNHNHVLSFSPLSSTNPNELCGQPVNFDKNNPLRPEVFPFIHMPTTTTPSFLKKLVFILVCGKAFFGWAQPDVKGCMWKQFLHENGSVASEGCYVAGVPTGVWTSYSDRGDKLSEGERRNNEPHGIWHFYQDGALQETATFEEGMRDGVQTLWKDGSLTDSVFWENGVKSGLAKSFRSDGSLSLELPYESNQREGKAILYNLSEEPNGYRWYKNNRLVASESFNRFDQNGLKTGPWKVFHPSGRVVESGFYLDDLRHGVFQFFDARGSVVRVVEFRHGLEVLQAENRAPVVELQEILREDGTLSETITYVDGVKQGVSRRFDSSGDVVGGSVFEQDVLVAEGITRKDGRKNGPWKDYWPNGTLRAEGMYVEDEREGDWVFYRESGEKEQQGSYMNGAVHGLWTWWYAGGDIHRKERYTRGELNGEFLELDTAGEALVQGQYEDGQREGPWRIHIHDHLEEGNYLLGQKDGQWTHTYGDGKRQFQGEFSFGQPVGKHRTWHPNGVIETEGKYESGAKHKKWRLHDDQGSLMHEYIYRYGKLRKVDGSKVDKRRDGKLRATER
jgi:antitoxin component YwqK of YwqJK toxin-antitoxin module